MSRFATFSVMAALGALALASCVRERERPLSDLLAPETSVPPGRLIRITAPSDGATLFKTHFSTLPGVQVTYSGTYVAGHRIAIEGFVREYAALPFASVEIPVGPDPPSGAVFLVGNAQYFAGNDRVVIVLRVFDADQALVSADSVRINVT